MKRSIRTLVLAALIIPASQAFIASAQNASSEQSVRGDDVAVEDGRFRCPETLPTINERTQEIERFLSWTKKHHPNWTLAQITAFRVAVLKRNECARTLENIQGHPTDNRSR